MDTPSERPDPDARAEPIEYLDADAHRRPSADQRPRVVLVDVMDTLVHEPFFDEIPAFFSMTLDALIEQKHPDSWLRFERGEIDEDTYFETFFRDGRPIDREGLLRTVSDAYRWVDGAEGWLTELHAAGHALHALSNYPIWYRRIEQKLTLSRFLSWSFVSCHTGVRKPDAEAFLGAARALGVPPEQCVFIDDRASNCDAARALGLDAIVAEDAEGVRAQLLVRGLISGDDPAGGPADDPEGD